MTGHDPKSYILPTADFNHLFEIAMIQAREHLADGKATAFIPVAYLYTFQPPTDRGSVIAVMPDFDVDHRYKYLEAFGVKMAEAGHLVIAFVFLSEAWRTSGPEPLEERPMPRDDPKRIETISAIGQTIDGRMAISFMDVRRNARKRMIPLATEHTPYDDDKPNDAQSDLCNAFWKGYRRGLQEKIIKESGGRDFLDRLHKKAPGKPPGASNYKFN